MTSILILHGYDDPMATPQNMIDLADELNSKAIGKFTHAAMLDMLLQILKLMIETRDYSTMRMDQHSWREMSNFFEKIFSECIRLPIDIFIELR